MRARPAAVMGMLFLATLGAATAEKPLGDYSFIRGACYNWKGGQAVIERDLGYAQRLQLNSTRVWLGYADYKGDPAVFIEQIRNYIETARQKGISTMPILRNGNTLDPDTLKGAFLPEGDAYVKAVVQALRDEWREDSARGF